jgi:hypothetical protein
VKEPQAELMHYQLLAKAREAEIRALKKQCDEYRAVLRLSATQSEKALREKLTAALLERDALREELQRRSERPKSAGYINFMAVLDAATTLNAEQYANWVRDHSIELTLGFQRSGEDEPAVYARIQYSRAMGLGV